MDSNYDKVVCAICGKVGRDLTKHINKEHNVNKRQYMEKYGVDPISQSCHDNRSKSKIGNKNRLGVPHTEETLSKFRESRLGEGNSFYGRSHSEESRKLISDARKREFSEGKREVNFRFTKDTSKLEEYLKNPYTEYSPQYRIDAISTYGHECHNCGIEEDFLEVHHLDGNRDNNDITNLVVLCKKCHMNVAHTRVRNKEGKFSGSKVNEEFSKSVINSRELVTNQ